MPRSKPDAKADREREKTLAILGAFAKALGIDQDKDEEKTQLGLFTEACHFDTEGGRQ